MLDTFYAIFSYNVQEIVTERLPHLALYLSGLSKNCSVSGLANFGTWEAGWPYGYGIISTVPLNSKKLTDK